MAALVVGTCATTWALCPAVAAVARRCGASVQPNGRSVHIAPVPLLGGFALFIPIACALLLTGDPHSGALIAGGAIVMLAGAWDDLRGLTPRGKIAAQVLAALALVAGGYRITGLRLAPLGTLPIGGFESAAVVAWIVLTTNAINLIDGVDGLATTLALVAALAHAALGFPFPLALALAGACLGFLRHNLPRARIFLGDTGSLLLGFLLGALALSAPGPLDLPLAVGVLAIPFGDVAMCVTRRWLRAKPLFAPDRGHLHHVLLRIWGQSAPRVVLGLGAVAVAQAVVIRLRPDFWGLLGAGCLFGATFAYVLSRVRPNWPRIVLHRHAFRRVHLSCNYARGAMQLCTTHAELQEVLRRVVEDLDLRSAEVADIRVERLGAPGDVVEERVDCEGTTASWCAIADRDDTALHEEKRIVMCDLLRTAKKRLGTVAPTTRPVPANGAPAPAAPARACASIHCIVQDLAQLKRITMFVPAMRQEGAARPLVVFAGSRTDLEPTDALDGIAAPVVCLDVPPVQDRGILEEDAGRRYRELLGRERPAATVVVGSGSVATACAAAARGCGVDVVHFDAPGRPRRRKVANGRGIIRVIPALPGRGTGSGADPAAEEETSCAH